MFLFKAQMSLNVVRHMPKTKTICQFGKCITLRYILRKQASISCAVFLHKKCKVSNVFLPFVFYI